MGTGTILLCTTTTRVFNGAIGGCVVSGVGSATFKVTGCWTTTCFDGSSIVSSGDGTEKNFESLVDFKI